jgi:hypothetical protein
MVFFVTDDTTICILDSCAVRCKSASCVDSELNTRTVVLVRRRRQSEVHDWYCSRADGSFSSARARQAGDSTSEDSLPRVIGERTVVLLGRVKSG